MVTTGDAGTPPFRCSSLSSQPVQPATKTTSAANQGPPANVKSTTIGAATSAVASRMSKPLAVRAPPTGMAGGLARPAGGMRLRAASLVFARDGSESPLTATELVEGASEFSDIKIRPVHVCGPIFRVCRLPEQKVAEANFTSRANDQIGIGHPGGVEIRGDHFLRDVGRVHALCHDSPHGANDLRPGAVVERHVHDQSGVHPRGLDRVSDALSEGWRDVFQGAQVTNSYSLTAQLLRFSVDHLTEDRKERVNLVVGPPPVLCGERVEREDFDANIGARLDDPPDVLGAGPVPGRAREATFGGPSTVAVHDDRHVLGDRDTGLDHLPGPRVALHQGSRISRSLDLRISSTWATDWSVIFCNRSWPRFRSSSEMVFSFSSRRRDSTASRRQLRTATRASSARRCTSRTSSLRRSSLSWGMESRMIVPSLLGFRPRSDFWIAFSISGRALRSHG